MNDIWKIKDYEEYKIYSSGFIKLKIYENSKYNKVYVAYMGYNITFTMMIWQFFDWCEDTSIKNYHLCDNYSKTHFIINKQDFYVFIQLIFDFISFWHCTSEDEKYKVDW